MSSLLQTDVNDACVKQLNTWKLHRNISPNRSIVRGFDHRYGSDVIKETVVHLLVYENRNSQALVNGDTTHLGTANNQKKKTHRTRRNVNANSVSRRKKIYNPEICNLKPSRHIGFRKRGF